MKIRALHTICDTVLAVIGISYLLYAYMSISYIFPYTPLCPFYALTSWHCPLCGMTRSLGELMHGNIDAALAYHPLAIVFLIFWICLATYYCISVFKKVQGEVLMTDF